MTGPQPSLDTAMGLGRDALNKVRAAAAELGVVLPERQVVYFLPVPVDCDQVAVAIQSWVPVGGSTDDELTACSSLMWNLRLFVTIARKSCAIVQVIGGDQIIVPSVEEMELSMRWASDDAEVLRAMALKYDRVGQGEIQFAAPEGEFQDVEIALTVPMGL